MRQKIITEPELRDIIDGGLWNVPGITINNDYTVARRILILRWWQQILACRDLLGITALKLTSQFRVKLSAEGVHVSNRTLYNWQRAFDDFGVIGLIDGRSNRGRTRVS